MLSDQIILIIVMCVLALFFRKVEETPPHTSPATVIGKRTDVKSMDTVSKEGYFGKVYSYSNVHSKYYVTFELENGARLELEVAEWQYGLYFEQDRGTLIWKGRRFDGFNRF